MYQISDPAEHDAVWGAIVSMGINGTEPFWLGLKQSGTKTNAFDSGWEWLNGDPLDPSWNLWDTRPGIMSLMIMILQGLLVAQEQRQIVTELKMVVKIMVTLIILQLNY
jgi:hypothetical protein